MRVTIAAMRVHRKMSQINAAKAVGVSPATLRSWEKGETAPVLDQLTRLCELYSCSLDDIFFERKSAKSG